LLGVDLKGEYEGLGEIMDDIMGAFDWLVLPVSGLLEKLPTRTLRRFRSSRARLNAMMYSLIANVEPKAPTTAICYRC
jgi:hypothetical protein